MTHTYHYHTHTCPVAESESQQSKDNTAALDTDGTGKVPGAATWVPTNGCGALAAHPTYIKSMGNTAHGQSVHATLSGSYRHDTRGIGVLPALQRPQKP